MRQAPPPDPSQRGYAMVALLAALSVMGVLLGAALPVYSTMARREREAELVFRGEQYARAIRLYQQQFGNALPPDVDALLGMRFLRREYLDPITGKEFQYLGPNDPELAEALNSEPAGARDREGVPENEFQQRVRETQELQDAAVRANRTALTLTGAGGIIAVASTSTRESLRLYNGRDHYNEWVFVALQTSQQAGQGAEGGAAGGRGGPATGLQLQPGGRGPRGGIGGRGGRGADGARLGGGRGGRGGDGGFGGGGRGGRGF